MVRKVLKKISNRILNRYGLEIIRKYEQEHLLFKNKEAVNEIENFFNEFIFPQLPRNANRFGLIQRLAGTGVSEAFYILHYLHKSLLIKGDVCEFGVANGATSALLANEIKKIKKNLWLFDSFKGLSKPTDKDKLIDDIFSLGSMGKYKGMMSYSVKDVKQSLNKISFPESRTYIIEGFVEDTLKKDSLPDAVCFAFIDVDLYKPTVDILEFLHTRLLKGGYLVVDDYGYFSSGVKTAVDNFYKKYRKFYKIYMPYKFAGHFCVLKRTR